MGGGVGSVGGLPLAPEGRLVVGGSWCRSQQWLRAADRWPLRSAYCVLQTFWLNGPFQHLDTLSTGDGRRSCRRSRRHRGALLPEDQAFPFHFNHIFALFWSTGTLFESMWQNPKQGILDGSTGVRLRMLFLKHTDVQSQGRNEANEVNETWFTDYRFLYAGYRH